MLFRSIDAKLPENYLTADRGIITVSSLAFKAQGGSELPSAKLRLSTKYDQVKVSGKTSKEQEGQTQWDLDEPLKLAFQTRHTSRLSIEFGRGFQIAGIGKDAEALATVQLGHLVDDKSLSLEIPVVSGDDIEDFQEHVSLRFFSVLVNLKKLNLWYRYWRTNRHSKITTLKFLDIC